MSGTRSEMKSRSECRSKRACSTGMTWPGRMRVSTPNASRRCVFSASAGSSRGVSRAESSSAAASRSGNHGPASSKYASARSSGSLATASGGASLGLAMRCDRSESRSSASRQASCSRATPRAALGAASASSDISVGRGDLAGKQRVGKDLPQPVDEAAALLARKLAHVDAVNGGEFQQHLHGERALVALDQIQVARRHAELGRHLRLAQRQPQPEPLQPRPGKDLSLGHVPALQACDRIYI